MQNEEPVLKLDRSPVQEEHIDFLLEEEFCCNANFLVWFLDQSFAKCGHSESDWKSGGNHGCRAVRSVFTERGESDVLVTYSGLDGSTVALLIEDKIGAGFQDQQAFRYRERGQAGIANGKWERFFTCLVSPERYANNCAEFDGRVSLEQLHEYFHRRSQECGDPRSEFKASVFQNALDHFGQKGPQNEDLGVTAFRTWYAAEAQKAFSNVDLRWDEPRRAWWGDTWFRFTSKTFGDGVYLMHKAQLGAVDLSFPNTPVESLERRFSQAALPDGAKLIQTGKSASIRLETASIASFNLSESHPDLSDAFAHIRALLDFYRNNTSSTAT